MSKLVVAEKPSVAQSIAKVLGVTDRRKGYLEGDDYLVSWCIGHLAELAPPEAYDEKYGKWRKADLPILPERWQYQVSAATEKQFQVLKQLMLRKDVTSLVCATDAGREGELIFRRVYHLCGSEKPVERLWISSMEDAAIREGFANLKPSSAYDALYQAALCRECADWLVGINATRLFSCLYNQTLNIGRVMTPTLAMVVQREAEITAFQPESFYTVHLTVGDCSAASRRFSEHFAAKELLTSCEREETATVKKVQRKEKAERPPTLYDLTTLQREANRLLGYTAQQTLDYTQSLYEKKLVTYPRTDSRFLTEDMVDKLPELVSAVRKMLGMEPDAPFIAAQVINGKKVSDHHAIIPTMSVNDTDLVALPAGEQAVLQLITSRLLEAVGQAYRYEETTVELECAGETFLMRERRVLDDGWKAINKRLRGKSENSSEENGTLLSGLTEGAVLPVEQAELREGKTTPPVRYTEDKILLAMETAGIEEGSEVLERRGIGTPATRAGIIEKLIQKGFLQRQGTGKAKYLIPTDRGKALITVLPEQLQSPAMTADWEERLAQIEQGDESPTAFMREIVDMIRDLVQTCQVTEGAKFIMSEAKMIGMCPHCGAEVTERQKGWFCSDRGCRFVLWKDNAYFNRIGKRLTGQIVEKLLRDGRVRLKDCQNQKTGRPYNATLLLTTEGDGRPRFRMKFEHGGERR